MTYDTHAHAMSDPWDLADYTPPDYAHVAEYNAHQFAPYGHGDSRERVRPITPRTFPANVSRNIVTYTAKELADMDANTGDKTFAYLREL